jgi:hypothetical protein
MRRLIAGLTTLAVLALAAAALAALPPAPSKFKGTTSSGPITDCVAPGKCTVFRAPVSFKVVAGGKSGRKIKKFKFGTLSCFGAGGFTPGKNPYTSKGSTAKVGSIAVSTGGKFSKTKSLKVNGAKTKVTVKAKFTRKASHGKVKFGAKGKLTITQAIGAQKCGPATVTFKAKRK